MVKEDSPIAMSGSTRQGPRGLRVTSEHGTTEHGSTALFGSAAGSFVAYFDSGLRDFTSPANSVARQI